MSILAIFLDASYFLARFNENDVHHKRTVILAEKIDFNEYGQALTLDDVFDDAVSVALRKFGKESAQTLGKQIVDSIFIIHGDKHLFDAAFRILNNSKDNFSFTDCMIQAVIDLAQIRYIATFDKLFEKLNIEVVK